VKGKQRMNTKLVHDVEQLQEETKSLSFPIFQTSTFSFETAQQGEKRFLGEEAGYMYSRLGNPTVSALERKIAELEGGFSCLSFGSGMAAVSAVLSSLTKAGDHVICSSGIYGCTYTLLEFMKKKYNITYDFCQMDTKRSIEGLIRPETACIFIETPINPTMEIVDLELIARIAKAHHIPVVVDNTFSSPYIQRPLEWGCNIVIHSATKYLGGHGDVVAGLVVGGEECMKEMKNSVHKDMGGILSPFDAWLLLRGIKTLGVRLDRQCLNAEKLMNRLSKHRAIENVYYPFDPNHAHYKIAKKQMSLGGGIISFEIKGGKEEAQAFLNALSWIKIAVSLGDVETLIQHPATMTHAGIPLKERERMGITNGLIRLSVGIEEWQDIWKDLKNALDRIQ
jgi:methionine-gamma-lyase